MLFFGDVVAVHRFLKNSGFEDRGVTRACLGHNPLIAGGVMAGTIVDGLFNVIVSAKVRKLGGASTPTLGRLRIHPSLPEDGSLCTK